MMVSLGAPSLHSRGLHALLFCVLLASAVTAAPTAIQAAAAGVQDVPVVQDHAADDKAGQGAPALVTTRGRALCADGGAWAGARIRLVSRLHPWLHGQLEVEAKADAEGRFTVELERDRRWLAWAWTDEGRFHMVSAPVPELEAGAALKLVAERLVPHCEVDIRGPEGRPLPGQRLILWSQRDGWTDAWQTLAHEGAGYGFDVPLGGKGRGVVPPLPWTRLHAELRDPTGRRSMFYEVDVAKGGPIVLQPAPTPAQVVRVVDENGMPVPEARAVQRLDGALVELAKADEQGRITLPYPLPVRDMRMSRGEYEFPLEELVAPGRHSEFGLLFNGGDPEEADPPRFVLSSGARKLEGHSLPGLPLVLQVNPTGRARTFPATFGRYPMYAATTDAAGAFAFDGIGDRSCRLYGLLDPATRDALRGAGAVEPQALLWCGPVPARAQRGLTLLPKDLVRVDVQVRDARGRAVEGARLLVLEVNPFLGPQSVVLRSTTDRRGSRRLLLPRSEGLRLVVATPRGVARVGLGLVDCARGQVLPAPVTVKDLPRVSGRVVDAKGAPVLGGRVFYNVFGKEKVEERNLLPDLLQARTDAEGRFELPILGGPGTLRLLAYRGSGLKARLLDIPIAGNDIAGIEIALRD